MYYLFGSNTTTAVVSNLGKSIRKDTVPMAWKNLRKLVVFQEVNLEDVMLRKIYLPVS